MAASTHQQVIAAIEAVFRNKRMTPPALTASTVLDSSLGLESLDFAEMVIRLEQAFGKDPFASGSIPQIRTVGDLAALYE